MESQKTGPVPIAEAPPQSDLRREFKLAREEAWNGVDEATLRRLRAPLRQAPPRGEGWHWSLVIVFWCCLLVAFAGVLKYFR